MSVLRAGVALMADRPGDPAGRSQPDLGRSTADCLTVCTERGSLRSGRKPKIHG